MTKIERFTRNARRSLELMAAEAERHSHPMVEPEHLLLGLVAERDGNAASILKAMGTDPDEFRQRIEQTLVRGDTHAPQRTKLSPRTERVLQWAVDEARTQGRFHAGTEHLLLGLLKEQGGIVSAVLSERGVTEKGIRAQMSTLPRELVPTSPPPPVQRPTPFRTGLLQSISTLAFPDEVSPVFIILILATLAAGVLTYSRVFIPRLTLFLFVTGGWIISLCLHEFGHAFVAYLGGDVDVVGKGYLTLNPLKYTHVVFSVIFPLVFLAMGGIGLPGGAVYINPSAIRTKAMRALVSMAGPLATLSLAILLVIPFTTGIANLDPGDHIEFWAGLALLAFLQITALLFNLLPIPPLDGFGIIGPYLPDHILRQVRGLGPFFFILVFFILSGNTPINRAFWVVIQSISSFMKLDLSLVGTGFDLFRFWTG